MSTEFDQPKRKRVVGKGLMGKRSTAKTIAPEFFISSNEKGQKRNVRSKDGGYRRGKWGGGTTKDRKSTATKRRH